MKYTIGDSFRLHINGETCFWTIIQIDESKNQYKLSKISNENKTIWADADIDFFDKVVSKSVSHSKISGRIIKNKEFKEQDTISTLLK